MERKFWACEEAGIAVYLPKPITSGVNAKDASASRTSLRPCNRGSIEIRIVYVISADGGGTHFQTKSLKTQLPKWRSTS
jgi:hypothetical protein